jgi:hypothetical protein
VASLESVRGSCCAVVCASCPQMGQSLCSDSSSSLDAAGSAARVC